MRALYLTLITATLFLSACGGGGSGGENEPTEPPPPPPVDTFSLSGTITASGSQAVDTDTNRHMPEDLIVQTGVGVKQLPIVVVVFRKSGHADSRFCGQV